jgi:peptide/nickel transport system substrate-binding protein
MKSNFKRFSAFLVLTVLLTAALTVNAQGTADVPREDTVIFDIDNTNIAAPTNFNDLVPGTNKNQGAHQSMWEPLFILNYGTGKIEPYLGTSFTPNDAQDVWTLKLHEGITWSDGVPFTADDVVFTIQLLLDDKTKTLNDAANMQNWVKSLKKIDDLTVEFDLNKPNPRFQLDYFSVRIWGSVTIKPKHVWEGQDPTTFTFYDPAKGWPIGTGPYKLTSASPDQFVWDRDDNWWGAKTGFHALPEPKRLIWVLAGSETNKGLLMSQHQLDSAMNISLGTLQAIQAKNPAAEAYVKGAPYSFADPCPRELDFNTEDPVWGDANLRKAVSLIIDRNQNIAIAYQGTTTPSTTMFVSYTGMDPFIKAITDAGEANDVVAHVEDGQKLIEAAGYAKGGDGIYAKDGKTLDLPIIVNNDTNEYALSTNELVEQLQQAGVNASSQLVNGATKDNATHTGNFTAAWGLDTCGSVSEPWNSMDRLNTRFYVPAGQLASGNYGRWNTDGAKAYSKIVDQIGVLPLGDPSIPGLVAQAYKYIADEMPVIPLVQAEKIVPFDNTYWTNWPTSDNPYITPTTWWQNTFIVLFNIKKATKAS